MNDVIIIGIDHHNALNLARCFYKKGIKVFCFVQTKKNHTYLQFSKYFKQVKRFQTVRDAFDYAKESWPLSSKKKPVLFPASDEAAAYADDNYHDLKNFFILPSIKCQQGLISNLMNKDIQKSYISSLGFPTADFKIIDLSKNNVFSPIFEKAIIKSVSSNEGRKSDISIANKDQFESCIKSFVNKGYTRILVEKYMDIDYEIQLIGCVCKNSRDIYFSIHKVIRTYPPGKGTGCYEQTITDISLIEQCEVLLRKIKDSGFSGLLDVEFFLVDKKIYVNEINWRNSGCLYNIWSNNYNFPYAWYLDATGLVDKQFEISNNRFFSPDYSMTEYSDIRYPIYHKEIVSFKSWLSQFRQCDNFAYWHRDDILPGIVIYLRLFLKFIQNTFKEE